MAEARAAASAHLSIDGTPGAAPAPITIEAVGDHAVTGRFQAVVNVHGCNLNQIEVALATNQHEIDRHPLAEGEYVARHPIYLVAFDPDPSHADTDGRPAEGAPAELNLKLIREVFSTRYPFVSPDGPPSDGSHVSVEGMHFVAEIDQSGNPTGRVIRGNPNEVPQ